MAYIMIYKGKNSNKSISAIIFYMVSILAIYGLHKNDLYHGHVWCPLKKHQKCSTEQKTRGQNVDPIKNYSQNTFVWIFPLINHNVSHKKSWITISNGARVKTKTVRGIQVSEIEFW